MKYFIRHPFKALKAWLPKSMFGRSLLILMGPLILVETLSVYIFFDNHWDTVTKALANTLAGEVATITALYDTTPKAENLYKFLAGTHLKLRVSFYPEETLQKPISLESQDSVLDSALKKHIFNPYTIHMTSKDIIIQTAVEDGVLEFTTPRKRLYSKSFYLFMMWVAGTSALFLLIATAFLHNQIKPLRRLAIAADRFGKGRSFPDFKPEGATEIRKVAQAFMRMRERLHRQITQRTEMLAGVSHDLRTPLTRMHLQLAMMPSSTEVDGLQKDIDEMGNMVEGYLTFARGDGLEETLETDLNELILMSIEGRADLKTIVHHTSQSLQTMSIKPQALKRCLTNLINNAARYGQEVWVTTTSDNDSLHISIEDDGPGIPEEKLEEVFKPFFRLDPSRNMATGGVGLGLTIARDIAQSHGGDIALSSSEAHGGLKACLILPY